MRIRFVTPFLPSTLSFFTNSDNSKSSSGVPSSKPRTFTSSCTRSLKPGVSPSSSLYPQHAFDNQHTSRRRQTHPQSNQRKARQIQAQPRCQHRQCRDIQPGTEERFRDAFSVQVTHDQKADSCWYWYWCWWWRGGCRKFDSCFWKWKWNRTGESQKGSRRLRISIEKNQNWRCRPFSFPDSVVVRDPSSASFVSSGLEDRRWACWSQSQNSLCWKGLWWARLWILLGLGWWNVIDVFGIMDIEEWLVSGLFCHGIILSLRSMQPYLIWSSSWSSTAAS